MPRRWLARAAFLRPPGAPAPRARRAIAGPSARRAASLAARGSRRHRGGEQGLRRRPTGSGFRFGHWDAYRSRSPKIAVPTRTMVAPSAIAASRSCDIPIESSGSIARHRAVFARPEDRRSKGRARCGIVVMRRHRHDPAQYERRAGSHRIDDRLQLGRRAATLGGVCRRRSPR